MGMIRSWKLPYNDPLLPDELRGAKVVLMKDLKGLTENLLQIAEDVDNHIHHIDGKVDD